MRCEERLGFEKPFHASNSFEPNIIIVNMVNLVKKTCAALLFYTGVVSAFTHPG
jgi:hypothetical protein